MYRPLTEYSCSICEFCFMRKSVMLVESFISEDSNYLEAICQECMNSLEKHGAIRICKNCRTPMTLIECGENEDIFFCYECNGGKPVHDENS